MYFFFLNKDLLFLFKTDKIKDNQFSIWNKIYINNFDKKKRSERYRIL